MPRLDALFGPLPREVPRYSTLDGFRALAILLLVVGHYARAWPPVPGLGQVSLPVDASIVALFVLTGFLVTERLLGEWDRSGDIAIGRYWVRKIIRFYPAFVVFVLFSSFHHLIVEVEVPLARVLSVLGLTGNYYYALAENDPHRHIIGHLWSVAVGAQFLAVWPWMLLGALRGGWIPWLVRGGVALVVMSMTLRTVTRWFTDVPPIYPYNATESRVDALVIGSLVALCLREPAVVRRLARLVERRALTWIALGGLFVSFGSANWYRAGPGYSVEALLLGLLIVAALRAERSAEWGWMRSRPMHAISVMSFSLFLWHLYPLTADAWLAGVPVALRITMTLALTGVVGAVGYLALERPFVRIARRVAGSAPAVVTV